ncbi:response regulator transcription factor [Blastococcus sp. CT_GayMR19]|uniref:response regulator n=1 Tax=Blastococcus sp. CT_GayMR19 TaxID=2559608 RepID=UPI001073F714|nr:response regulator transcription factor [Blastococcus sp. CT_GayMR19]TFV73843.1 response regulator transcription factor [Blastococcus sp. CT_GayMR19]
MITVVIADDQPLMRGALRTCLEAEPDIEVVGEAADGAAAVRLVQQLRPAVVVMDVRMPIMDGIEATRRLAELPGEMPRVLVMTTFDLDEYIIGALRAGASGFLVKDSAPQELVHAVRLLAAGQALLAPSVTRRLLDLRARTLLPVPTASRDSALSSITAREMTVLKLAARGLSNADIAMEMDLAPSSVKTHVGHLLAKLGFTDRVQLVVFAYEHELVRPGTADAPPAQDAGPRSLRSTRLDGGARSAP